MVVHNVYSASVSNTALACPTTETTTLPHHSELSPYRTHWHAIQRTGLGSIVVLCWMYIVDCKEGMTTPVQSAQRNLFPVCDWNELKTC